MDLLTPELRERLLANGRAQAAVRGTDREIDFAPVVKLFTPDAGATWLLTEIEPDDPDDPEGGTHYKKEFQDEFDRYYDEHDEILTGGPARSPRMIAIDEADAAAERGVWRVEQTIDDPAGDHDWRIRAEVDLQASVDEGAAIVRVTEVVRL